MCKQTHCRRHVWCTLDAYALGGQSTVSVFYTYFFAFYPTFRSDHDMSSQYCCRKTSPKLCRSFGGIVHDVSISVDDGVIFRKFVILVSQWVFCLSVNINHCAISVADKDVIDINNERLFDVTTSHVFVCICGKVPVSYGTAKVEIQFRICCSLL